MHFICVILPLPNCRQHKYLQIFASIFSTAGVQNCGSTSSKYPFNILFFFPLWDSGTAGLQEHCTSSTQN